jgi:hypothetical protein
MGLILREITDPRDALAKARRYELFQFAKANGVTEIIHAMPANIMRKILRSRGLTNIRIPQRTLGVVVPTGVSSSSQSPVDEHTVSIDAEEDMLRQFNAAMKNPVEPQQNVREQRKMFKPRRHLWRELKVDEMKMNDMRFACGELGIAMSRHDRKPVLREKLINYGLK